MACVDCVSKKTLTCCGCCNCMLGTLLLALGLLLFPSGKTQLVDNVYDLMFIDDTSETDYEGPLGVDVAETEQFKKWKKPAKQAFEECEKEHSAAECINGIDVTVAVFNVTNPTDILKGGLPNVQELGPIHLKMYQDKIDIDTKLWDETGVAKFRVDTTYELDPMRCDQSCVNLLEHKIIVPNPAWASVSAMGAELVVATIVTVSAVTAQGMNPADVLGLSKEEAPFLAQIFSDQNKLALVGAFLATASATAGAAAQGNLSGTCQLGGLELPAMKCIQVLTKIQEMMPMSWAGTMKSLSPVYGTGAAAPVFIQVKVKEALGFNGSVFTDPLLAMSLSFGGLHSHLPPQSDPEGVFRYAQMSSKFASKGTGYVTHFDGASEDCRYDLDCKLESTSRDSCAANNICTPASLSGYMMTGLPGRLWGTASGFKDFQVGQIFPSFKNGKTSKLRIAGEKKHQVSGGAFSGGEIEYLEVTYASLNPRIENCDGEAPGSPGIDCFGPLHAINLGPAAKGMPLYVSMPYFDDRLLRADSESHQQAVQASAYNPAGRVSISKCTNNDWCNDDSFEKENAYIWVEPNSGAVFRAQGCIQYNVRIGFVSSMLHPGINDALVPVFWVKEAVVPPERLLIQVMQLQSAPAVIEMMSALTVFVGSIMLCCACCCVGQSVGPARKTQGKHVQDQHVEKIEAVPEGSASH